MENGSSEKLFWGMSENSYMALMHACQLVTYFIGPFVMWLLNKEHSAKIDACGKSIFNFTLSWVIYMFGRFILSFVIIGIFVNMALGLAGFIFIIIGAVKASKGEIWKYPMTIRFFK